MSYWLVQLYGTNPAANLAISTMGSNAIPGLLRMLRTHDSPLKTKVLTWVSRHSFGKVHYMDPSDLMDRAQLGFELMGPQAANAVPELIEILDQNVSPESKISAMGVLGWIGPDAKTAVPALLRSAASTNIFVHQWAVWALIKIHADPKEVVPVLIKELQDTNSLNRWTSVTALGTFQNDARPAVPSLLELLKGPEVNSTNSNSSWESGNFIFVEALEVPRLYSNTVRTLGGRYINPRTEIEHALQQIDPETYPRIVTNTASAATRSK